MGYETSLLKAELAQSLFYLMRSSEGFPFDLRGFVEVCSLHDALGIATIRRRPFEDHMAVAWGEFQTSVGQIANQFW